MVIKFCPKPMRQPVSKNAARCFLAARYRAFIALLLLALAAGCGSGNAQLEGELSSTEQSISRLAKALDTDTLRNATIIKRYAGILTESRPELRSLLLELSRESSSANPTYKSLKSRYEAVRDDTEYFDSWADKVQELQLVQAGADPAAFNDSLSDTVNVIADLSNGQLARVNAVSRETEQAMNNTSNQGAGSQYVGNPHYGHWSQSSGGSFWAWYGQYYFFSSLLGGRPHYYNNWAGGRGYSYYHDVGRQSYTSRSQRSAQTAVDQREKKQFGARGGYKSPYSRTRSGATGMSRASVAKQKSTFKSPYSKSSSASAGKYQSSLRSGGYRTSKGVSRGK
ncbi:MAG: hypothetical protein KUG79_05390 [Pseudomonadales bacterium]|nr:hypothetical protein [Pseudomonadales bacterium]